ncbi:hypothetical protein O0I10_010792 [Lichtheimia ornata]|uniref:DUF155 domain-containing protein n=1 Tax=Lichtheimia ornata TaxID=688661 RepID=A0AAD7UU10_9FUNG|nr:uncharacterized protein O0I10_010792 [Lichtheimia ornata]KAJ8653553.1 hypothetical protein O0I10_010792 [Lichtheimia ornata]
MFIRLLGRRAFSTSIRGIGKHDQDVGALQNLMRMVNDIEAYMNPLATADFKVHTQQCKAYCTPEAAVAIPSDATLLPVESEEYKHAHLAQGGEVFVFPQHNTHVAWATTTDLVTNTSDQPHQQQSFAFAYDQDEPTCVKGDLILLNPEQSPTLAKVALSYGMARSVRLAVFEQEVDAMIKQGSTLQEEALLQFRERLCNEADLGLLGTPDLTWARSDLQAHYTAISNRLDIGSRIAVMHKKLEFLQDRVNASWRSQLVHLLKDKR